MTTPQLTRSELLALAAICDARGHPTLADRCQQLYEDTERTEEDDARAATQQG